MFTLIKNYVEKMTMDDVNNYALKNDIHLSQEELLFTYNFIKKNYEILYSNPYIDLSKFKSKYSEENFIKISKLIEKARNLII